LKKKIFDEVMHRLDREKKKQIRPGLAALEQLAEKLGGAAKHGTRDAPSVTKRINS